MAVRCHCHQRIPYIRHKAQQNLLTTLCRDLGDKRIGKRIVFKQVRGEVHRGLRKFIFEIT